MLDQYPSAGRKSEHKAGSPGFTLIEMLVVVAVISTIAAVAVPKMLRARVTANHSAAVASVRTLSSAQIAYSTSCGGGGFADTMAGLLNAPAGTAPFASPDLGAASKSGYVFGMNGDRRRVLRTRQTCNRATQSMAGFIGFANPLVRGTTGDRSFAVSESGVIRWDGRRNITNRNRYNRATVLQ